MSVNTAFQPAQGTNQNLTATTTSAIADLPRNGCNQIRITVKAGGGDGYFYSYSSTTDAANIRAATTADFCIVAGQSTTFTRAIRHDKLAYITDTGTAAFKLITGDGV
jgi:Fe-S cluster assembly iron-binding protein IscA